MKDGNNKIIMFLMLILAFVLSIFKKKTAPEVVPGTKNKEEKKKTVKKYIGANGHLVNYIYQSKKWGYLGGRGDFWRTL